MKRFLMLVAVAAVAAAMYVAASPASQQSSGVTAKQFKALKAQVANLSKSLKSTRAEADAAVGFIANCLVSANAGVWGVSEFGDGAGGTFGYRYTEGGTNEINVTALDFDGSGSPDAYLQSVDPTCVQALRHQLKPATAHLPLSGERSH
jgi:outer membrane murein-binding lipoprotein Lpp